MPSVLATNEVMAGTRPAVMFTFSDAGGELADPTTSVEVRVMSPSGDVSVFGLDDDEVVRLSLGVFSWQPAAALAEPGTWWVYCRAEGGGADVAAEVDLGVVGPHVPVS